MKDFKLISRVIIIKLTYRSCCPIGFCSNAVSFGGSDLLGQPVETLVESITSGGAGGLDVPGLTTDGVEGEFVSDLWGGHGSRQVLLVSVHEDDGVLELLIVDHLVKLLAGIIDSIAIVGVDDENDTLSVGVVVTPQLSDLILTSDVPHVEGDVLVGDLLNVESNCWNWCYDLAELELVEDGGLTSGVKTNHKNTHLSVSEHPCPDLGEHASHIACLLVCYEELIDNYKI